MNLNLRLNKHHNLFKMMAMLLITAFVGACSNNDNSTSTSRGGSTSPSSNTSIEPNLSLKIDSSHVSNLVDGDLFDPTQLIIKVSDGNGEDIVVDLANVIIKVDNVKYEGTPVEVHYPSCSIKAEYTMENQPLSNEATISVGKKPAKVIIMAGQSNMVGHSMVYRIDENLQEKYKNGFDNVLIYNSCNPYNSDVTKYNFTSDFVPVKAGMGRIPNDTAAYPDGCFGPELGLAEYLSEQYPNETFYIIKDATGGTTLHDRWYSQSSFEYLGVNGYEDDNLYAHLLTRINEGMGLLNSKNLDAKVIAFLWMQGENDARTNINSYETLWTNLVNDLTDELKNRDFLTENGLSTIDGGITEHWTNCEQLNGIKERWAAERSKSHYIDVMSAGLTRNPNDLAHLDSPSMLKLGKLFGEKLSLVIEDLHNKATFTPVTLKGAGTESDPYLINSYEEWLLLSYISFTNHDSLTDKFIKITSDIGSEDRPVRTSLGAKSATAFSGTIDGDGHTIYLELLFSKERTVEKQALGLINYASGATIKNLTVEGSVTYETSGYYVGGFIGLITSSNNKVTTISNCINKANINVTADSNAAGFVGRAYDSLTIINCENMGLVSSTGKYVGGFVGYVHSFTNGIIPSITIENSTNSGDIKGSMGVGGFVGLFNVNTADGTHRLLNVSNTGKITGTSQAGGIIGRIANGTFDIEITYREAGCADESGNDIVVGSSGNKQETSITKISD